MLVEFPEPTYNKGDTYEWKATVAPNNVWYDFDVSELPTRKINGRKIQRFMLKNLSSDLGPGVTSKRLGKVLFVVENENRTRYMKFDRTLDVVLTHHRELGQEFYQGDSGDESNHEVLEREEEEFGKTLFLSEVVKEIERRRKPEKSKVTFEEIDSGLEVGVKTWKLCEIGRCGKRHEIFNPKDLDSISISNDTDLVIVLPFTNEKRWGVEIKGRWLRIDYTLVDGNRQRFTFNPKPKDEHRQDTDEIIFRCAGQEKRVFVRKYIPMVWSDCDRYPD